MPPGARYFGAKMMGSPGHHEPSVVEYVIVLFDRQTGGSPRSLMGMSSPAFVPRPRPQSHSTASPRGDRYDSQCWEAA